MLIFSGSLLHYFGPASEYTLSPYTFRLATVSSSNWLYEDLTMQPKFLYLSIGYIGTNSSLGSVLADKVVSPNFSCTANTKKHASLRMDHCLWKLLVLFYNKLTICLLIGKEPTVNFGNKYRLQIKLVSYLLADIQCM